VIAQLVAFDKQRPNDGPQILMVSRGDPDTNQRKLATHDIGFPVVLQDRWTLSKLYGIFTFPAAFLIDTEGTMTHEVVQGPEIATLLMSFSRSPIAISGP